MRLNWHFTRVLSVATLLSLACTVPVSTMQAKKPTSQPKSLWQESGSTAILAVPNAITDKPAGGLSDEEPNTAPAYNTRFTSEFPDNDWWLRFNDLQLNQYMAEAIANNPRLEGSVERIKQARAQVQVSFAKQLPSLSFSPSYLRLGLPSNLAGGALSGTIQAFLLAFQPSWELDLFGKNLNRTQSAKKEAEAVALDARALLVSLEGEVATAYFNLMRSDTLVESQERNLMLLKRVNALKRNQHDAGLTSYDEVVRSERDVALALTNLTNFRQQRALFAHQLSVLTGNPPAIEASLSRGSLDEAILPVDTQSGSPEDMLARRPDIAAAELRLKKAAIDVKIARKAFLPSLNLSAIFSTAGSNIGDVVDMDTFTNVQIVQGSQPIFKGGQLVAEAKYQKSRQREQMSNYRQTVLSAMKEVEDQLALLKSSYDSLNSNNQRLTLTDKNLKITEDRQKQGLIPRLDVLQAESELIQYQQLKAQSKADALIATVNLYKSLGGGF